MVPLKSSHNEDSLRPVGSFEPLLDEDKPKGWTVSLVIYISSKWKISAKADLSLQENEPT